ncbi:hypothetical protein BIV25_36400 [Streptomyces sp. MUSC 14]|uniref:divalent metal cation transporter n=1 Tax=Streptomyces sp. MUSC 14 TaxID=1354889 RepID=UPI0008F5CABA|nr:divalent metal cation transporter [Streptomyces sp. MUSC 14]OIJ88650.1 hypothetical protein BIV25_36400 [Streptomyces sp. MUSC 14]
MVRQRAAHGGIAFAVALTLALITCGFIGRMPAARPSGTGTVSGPRQQLPCSQALLLACGILGATVMPHAVYMHSAPIRDSAGRRAPGGPGRIRGR